MADKKNRGYTAPSNDAPHSHDKHVEAGRKGGAATQKKQEENAPQQ